MARGPYKKDLTPIGRGGINKFVGKGAREQVRSPSGAETLTGGDPFARATNRYPKAAPEPAAPEPEEAPPVPMGQAPARLPTALMPGGNGGNEDEAA
jgi:hypothetical protein